MLTIMLGMFFVYVGFGWCLTIVLARFDNDFAEDPSLFAASMVFWPVTLVMVMAGVFTSTGMRIARKLWGEKS